MTEQMVMAMKRLAMFRQAEVSAQTYVAYALALSERLVRVEDVEVACRRLEATERAEGETAFPSLGTLLRVCGEVAHARRERHRLEAKADVARRQLAASLPRDLSPREAKEFVGWLRDEVARARGL